MSDWTDEAIETHVQRFLAQELSAEEWSPHASHLVAAVWHVRRYGRDEALERMRRGIQSFNRAVGTAENAYHETVTRFYVTVIAELVAKLDAEAPNRRISTVVAAVLRQLGTSRKERMALWSRYYRDPQSVIQSDRARLEWVPPDRDPDRSSS